MKRAAVCALLVVVLNTTAEAQEARTADRTRVGVMAGGFNYYFGSWPFYPLLSGRLQHRIVEMLAVEASLTAVAAGEELVCPGIGPCAAGQEFTPLLYPGLGVQLRLPTGPVSPYIGGSIATLLGGGMVRSTSLELGIAARHENREYAIEVRRRSDDHFTHIETKATELSLGVYWTVR